MKWPSWIRHSVPPISSNHLVTLGAVCLQESDRAITFGGHFEGAPKPTGCPVGLIKIKKVS